MALSPLNLEETWTVRDAAPKGAAAEQIYAAIGRQTEGTDVLVLHRSSDADPIIVLPWLFWKRVLLTVKAASAEPRQGPSS